MSRADPPLSSYSEFSFFKRRQLDSPWERKQRHLEDWAPSLDLVKNDNDCIRWGRIRSAYFSHIVDLDFCVEAYREWRDDREDLWLDAISTLGEILGTVFVVAAKRGNEWYKKRLNQKFSFFEQLEPIQFFCEEWGHKTTPMLFVSLTVDPALVGNDLDQAWDGISDELHSFETKLRQKYGRFVKLRVWEAHSSGYPHCHVVYYFLNRRFEVWEHFPKKGGKFVGKRVWHVSDAVRDKIQSFWGLAHSVKIVDGVTKRVPSVDIQGVSDTIGAFSEVRKYLTKTIWSKKGDLTATLCCLHRKQVYWLSQNDYVKQCKTDPALRTCKTVAQKSVYLNSAIPQWAKKDFIGAIWGFEAYMDFYKELHSHGHDEGMAEPGLSALVTQFLHSCNKRLLDIDHFVYRGCFRHADLSVLLPVSDNWSTLVDPPPDEVRLLLGVDRIVLTGGSTRSRWVDPDAFEVFD